MDFAMIGLGKMGSNMVRRLIRQNHRAFVYDLEPEISQNLAQESESIIPFQSLSKLVESLDSPRIIWMMVPHDFVDETIEQLLKSSLIQGDVIVDGGNSNYKKSQKRAQNLSINKIHFMDCGTSGGVWGLENGYSMMVGGSQQGFNLIKPLILSLAPDKNQGWGHVGPSGAGHFTKMVHNGIEYGMMEAFAEGFELMQSKTEMALDLEQIASIWQQGSVVRSWLLDLIHDALADETFIASLSDYVDDSGEGRWTIQESIENAVPTPVLSLALQMRFRSRQSPSYSGKLLNAMRAGFGGHAIKSDTAPDQ